MQLPPLAAIRVFESAARHLSFTKAATELGMTQAGVSYQIKLLEERLGTPLFLRKPRALQLTRLGTQLSAPTSQAFEILRHAYADPTDSGKTLSISSPITLAGNWLGERLGRFQMEHPALSIKMDANDRLVDFAHDDVDIAIRHGDGDWPGLTAQHLFDFEVTPMLSPNLLKTCCLETPEQLRDLPWIDPQDPNWELWIKKAGVTSCACYSRQTPVLGTQVNEARAAIADQGVAMLSPRFFRYELASGSLIQPFQLLAGNGKAYWLVYPEARRNRPTIRAFRQFLLAEIAADS